MRKFLLGCLAIIPFLSRAQQVSVSGNSVSFDAMGRVINPATNPNTRIWVEPGDGTFFSQSFSSHTPAGNQITHKPLLFRTNLYDTSRGNRSTYVSAAPNAGSLTMVPTLPALAPLRIGNNNSVTLFSSVPEVVPNDTMVFAITYNLADTGSKYYVVLFYNDNSTFLPLTTNANITLGTDNFKSIRVHRGEAIGFDNMGVTPSDGLSYGNAINFALPKQTGSQNLYVTLVPKKLIDVTAATNVLAVLYKQAGKKSPEVVASSKLSALAIDPAHDPNNLIVTPTCLKLPVAANRFDYVINFQNIGGGPADKIRIEAQLPAGMDWGSFAIDEVVLAGTTYTAGNPYYTFTQTINAGTNRAVFVLTSSGEASWLRGTTGTPNPDTNRVTMGHVKFHLVSTAATGPTLKSFADIYLRSITPSGNVVDIDGIKYEQPIRTNTGICNYVKDCEDKQPVDDKCNCKKPGNLLCWVQCYWWVIVIIVLILLFLILRSRKK